MATTFTFEFDWDNDGSWTDEASEIRSAHIRIGMAEGAALTDTVAQVGTCILMLDNSTQRYSPDYASGDLFGKLLPRRPVRVRASDGVTTWTVFRGYIERIEPDSGPQGRRRVVITCIDTLALLRDQNVTMDLQENKRADQIIAGAVNLALGAPAASATITLTSNSLNGDVVRINGTVYTFKTALTPLPYEVLIGANTSATAANLKAAINSEGIIGTTYGSGTNRLAGIVASVSSNVVTVTATLPGSIGNSYTLTKSGTAMTLSGSTLSGGVDTPSGLCSYLPSTEQFSISADRWTDDRTSTLQVIHEAALSDQGRFFVQRDGTVTYLDRTWFFEPLVTALAFDANAFEVRAVRSIDQVYNVINVTIYPRATVGAAEVLAKAGTVIRLPPYSVLNPTERRVTLHFRDTTGKLVGGKDVVLPLVATTDYTVNQERDGSSVDYTTNAAFSIGTIDLKASQITIPLRSTALVPLYVTKLQVRGKPVTTHDPLTITQSDSTSQATYQKRMLSLELPLSSDENFAEALCLYLLSRYKAPSTDLQKLTIRNTDIVNGVNVFSIDLFDVLAVTDSQTGVSDLKCYVTGIALDIVPEGFVLAWNTARADDQAYWNLGVTGYGELNTNTRLAV